jgi:hypothetical protein
MATPDEIRNRWKEQAQRALPEPGLVRERNAAITTRYATFFVEAQPLFKWSGLAVFASHQVGLALLPYDCVLLESDIGEWRDPKLNIPVPLVGQELELLRKTNNKVYDDIAWAHLAYLSPDGGLAAVEAGLQDVPTHCRMLQGFQKIDEGRRLLESPRSAEANSLIWQGNRLLLEHEQVVMVQPAFAAMDPAFEFALTQATMLAFETHNFSLFMRYRTFFSLFMYTHGLPVLLRTHALPELRVLEHRWFWITKSALALWQRINQNPDRALQAVLNTAPSADSSIHADEEIKPEDPEDDEKQKEDMAPPRAKTCEGEGFGNPGMKR